MINCSKFAWLTKRGKKFNKKPKEITSSVGGDVVFTPIYHNDAISIVHDACVICVDGKKERTLEEKIEFIAGKVKLGHESILEHTNYIVKLNFHQYNGTLAEAFMEMSDCFKYLNVKTKIYSNEYYTDCTVLIGGSVRGYKHMIRTIKNYKNPIYITLLDYIKLEMPSCFFSDLIADGIFDEDQFLNVYEKENGYKNADYRASLKVMQKHDQSKVITLFADSLFDVYNKLNKEFDYYELMDFCCINTAFVNVSRACSHQLVRHRAGITQLSQRYVDMSDAVELNSLIPTTTIDLSRIFYNSPKKDVVMDTDKLITIYNEIYKLLLDKGWKREDARYFLPNIAPTTLYMTFTYRGFLKAYQLRTGNGAQREIKLLFKSLFKSLDNNNCFEEATKHAFPKIETNFDILDYVKPRYEFEEILAEKYAQGVLKEGNYKEDEVMKTICETIPEQLDNIKDKLKKEE